MGSPIRSSRQPLMPLYPTTTLALQSSIFFGGPTAPKKHVVLPTLVEALSKSLRVFNSSEHCPKEKKHG